jgi:hypothetical protein
LYGLLREIASNYAKDELATEEFAFAHGAFAYLLERV